MYKLFSGFPFHVCQTFISSLFQGAPETIQEMLIDLPPSYVQTYKKYTRQGSRVLALAYKFLPEMTVRVVLFCDNLFWIFPPYFSHFPLLLLVIFVWCLYCERSCDLLCFKVNLSALAVCWIWTSVWTSLQSCMFQLMRVLIDVVLFGYVFVYRKKLRKWQQFSYFKIYSSQKKLMILERKNKRKSSSKTSFHFPPIISSHLLPPLITMLTPPLATSYRDLLGTLHLQPPLPAAGYPF